MARTPKLKVFRTPIGFHDAYVAAPSQKAALKAWGSDRDLFARGVAERVDDPALMREPLAHPGTVIRRTRGTVAEQIAALPKDKPRRRADSAETPPPSDRSKPRRPASRQKAAKPKRPDRDALDAAERALAEAEKQHRQARAEFARREAALAKERRELEQRLSTEEAKLAQAVEKARTAYDRALRAWRG